MSAQITVTTGTGSASVTVSTGARGPAGSDAAVTLSAIIAHLGISTYADLSAANAALGEINRTYYDESLARLNQTDDID